MSVSSSGLGFDASALASRRIVHRLLPTGLVFVGVSLVGVHHAAGWVLVAAGAAIALLAVSTGAYIAGRQGDKHQTLAWTEISSRRRLMLFAGLGSTCGSVMMVLGIFI